MLRNLVNGALRSGALSSRRSSGGYGTGGGYDRGTGGGMGSGMGGGGGRQAGLSTALGLASRFMRRR